MALPAAHVRASAEWVSADIQHYYPVIASTPRWAKLDLNGKPFAGGQFNQSDCKVSGPSEIEEHCLLDMGLSEDDVLELTAAWRQTTAEVSAPIVLRSQSSSGWGVVAREIPADAMGWLV